MPRSKNSVKLKSKNTRITSGLPRLPQTPELRLPGLVDVHFHGAWGVDLTLLGSDNNDAESTGSGQTEINVDAALDHLSRQLALHGTAAFCPTTITAPFETLLLAVDRLGRYILKRRAQADEGITTGLAMPLGIHLEGPFLGKAGAHPVADLLTLDSSQDIQDKLEALWIASHKTLLIITLAPEVIALSVLPTLADWAKRRGIRLSVGHTCADHARARTAFENGFTGITHLWNAMDFHHRKGGVVSAALAHQQAQSSNTQYALSKNLGIKSALNKKLQAKRTQAKKAARIFPELVYPEIIYPELIIDGQHVAPAVIQMSLDLFKHAIFVSDCAPAAGLGPEGGSTSFGPGLRVRDNGSVCVLTSHSALSTALTRPTGAVVAASKTNAANTLKENEAIWAGANQPLAVALSRLVPSLLQETTEEAGPTKKARRPSKTAQISKTNSTRARAQLKRLLPHATTLPLQYLGISGPRVRKLLQPLVTWTWDGKYWKVATPLKKAEQTKRNRSKS